MAKERVIEIDLLRTIAIGMMITYHAAYDLRAFYGWRIDLFGTEWQTFRIATASLFLLLAGVATNFSHQPLKRSLIVLACAAVVSIATYISNPATFIYFGILHCIGVGLLLLIPLRKLKEWNIFLGLLIITMDYGLLTMDYPIRPTLDYYPLIPWAGLMLIGAGIGHWLYIRHSFRAIPKAPHTLLLPGKHSLVIYLVHQPILLGLLWFIL